MERKCLVLLIIVAMLLGNGTSSLAAESETLQFFEEEAKVITASRRPQAVQESPVAVDVLTSEEIRASGAANLWDLLRNQPGVEVVDGHTPHGDRALVSIRGFVEGFARNVLVLVDGRSVYDANTGGVHWEQLPAQIQDVERIEIIRGPNAALYGSGAGLGVINIITKKPNGFAAGAVSGAKGNRNASMASEAVDSSIHGIDFRLSHTYQEQGGFDNVAGGTGNDFLHINKLNLRSRWKPTQNSELEFFAGGSWSKIGVPNVQTAQDSFNQHFEMLKFNAKTSDNSSLEVLSSRSDYIYSINPTTIGDSDRARNYQYNEDITHRIDWADGRMNSTYGFNYQYAHVYSLHQFSGDPSVKNQVGRGFLNQTARLGQYVTLVGAAAWEATDVTRPHLNYQIASLLEPVKGQTFRASYSVAYTIPTLRLVKVDEVQSPGVARLGNSSMLPEKLTSYETGYRGNWFDRRVEAESNLFYTRIEKIDDDVDLGTTPIDYITFTNSNQAIARGAELQFKYRFSPRRSAYVNYTYEEITDWSGNIGEVTESTPEHTVNLGGIADLGKGFSGSFNLGYKDHYIIDNLAAEAAIPSYWRLDMRMGYVLPFYKDAEIFLAGQNLLRPSHPEFADGLTVPRTYRGGVTVKF